MKTAASVSVIIPTKNRGADLVLTIQTLLRQSVLPAELFVVDQSDTDVSRSKIESLLSGTPLCLHYTYDPAIPGGAVARNLAMDRATGEILLFLDDDVELEESFVEELLATYASHAEVAGVSGVATNYEAPSTLMRAWLWTFERGPFHDDRQPVYWRAAELRDSGLYRVTRMTGALMSFRASAVVNLRFDAHLKGVSDGEDVDLCMRLGPQSQLVINPRARLVHNRSATGRLEDHWLRRYLRSQLYLYRRNWNVGIKNRLCLGWLLLGAALIATLSSVRSASFRPWRALLTGYREGVLAAEG
jgi:GT2 family glycosyltransferase